MAGRIAALQPHMEVIDMPGQAFRFVHAADLHLEQPVTGLPEAPEHLRDLLISAPLAALRHLVETALHEEAAFVLLAGDVIDPQAAGPRPLAFLVEQLERLAARDIAVYWASGRCDLAERWTVPLPLPPNVHLFRAGEAELVVHERYEQPLAAIVGRGFDGRLWKPGDFRPETSDRFTVALAHCEAAPDGLAQHAAVHYWALGGQHRRSPAPKGKPIVHFPGTTQGRLPGEAGEHGCAVVEVDGAGAAKLRFAPCDSVRWKRERLELRDEAARDELERALRRRVQAIAAESPGKAVLVDWTISGGRRLSPALRTGKLAGEVIAMLRSEFGGGAAPVWTSSLSLDSPDDYPESWLEEDTILGDFLRAVRQSRSGRASPHVVPLPTAASEAAPGEKAATAVHAIIDDAALRTLLPVHERQAEVAAAATVGDARQRDDLLRRAAAYGADLLRGE